MVYNGVDEDQGRLADDSRPFLIHPGARLMFITLCGLQFATGRRSQACLGKLVTKKGSRSMAMPLSNRHRQRNRPKIMKILMFTLLLVLTVPSMAADIKTGDDLVAAMYKKYEGKWYKTLTFEQKTTNYKPDGTTDVQKWYEAF